MDRFSADAYVYARASEILAKSFVGPRVAALFEVRTLQELWALLFTEDAPMLPEVLFARALEVAAVNKFVRDYITLLSAYSKPGALITGLIRSFDYDNLKMMAAAAGNADSDLKPGQGIDPGRGPRYSLGQGLQIIDISPYAMLNYTAWPDIARVTRGSPVSWYDRIPAPQEQQALDERLDKQWTSDLWRALQKSPKKDREAVEDMVKRYIVETNILWAIRLKVYFEFSPEEILPRLAYSGDKIDPNDPLAREAARILDYPINSYAAWEKWRYAGMLNPHSSDVPWTIDPGWMSRSFRRNTQHTLIHIFHQQPFTDAVLGAWFFIKRYELNCIRTVTESLRLNVGHQEAREFAGV
ncbi:MAG: V-type ATPase subunit [Spirochaetaceae bacterium]|jgi:vacuolar-type H+-ATPase subunit C/Vma6|nr:V-type ATPase subunit [Spirochaetaceae bacterium]